MGWRHSKSPTSFTFAIGSKPTVWDGDLVLLLPTQPCICIHVLSPPCGMETEEGRLHFMVYRLVLSPPCGMETPQQGRHHPRRGLVGSKPTVWDGDISSPLRRSWMSMPVLSPPCGMETCVGGPHSRGVLQRSKPTVWDGDVSPHFWNLGWGEGSKPTVWDGDQGVPRSASCQTGGLVLSPPCGMETGFTSFTCCSRHLF